jgi:CheY-like chemotaxis protein
MKTPLRILHLEDDANDAALIQATLKAGGISFEAARVQTPDDFVAALNGGGIDLILSDFTLPTFDGLSALKIARATGH